MLVAVDMSSAAESRPLTGDALVTLPDTGSAPLPAPRIEPSVDTQDDGLTLGTRPSQEKAIFVQPVEQPAEATSLAALVDQVSDEPTNLDAEAHCLATAVFYEARSESLAGQLAVARVVINRAESGRFPSTLCGVVTQPYQFSFVRGGVLPEIRGSARAWTRAVAIARIALRDAWDSKAEGALYFHARRVSPGWRRTQLAQIDNHIFYR